LAIKPCENCTTLKNQVKYLLKTCAKFKKGKANLEAVLGSQIEFSERLDLVIHLSMKRNPRSSLVSFPRVSQMICPSFLATTV